MVNKQENIEKKESIEKKKVARVTLKINESEGKRRSGMKTVDQYRSEFMRDRDRVLYSKAFRRLAGKAQVFISGVDDHKRTRLTHTLEVSQIARSIADPLKLDVDLVEAIALGHDLGHTPFGHAGERTLHLIMTPNKNHILGEDCPLHTEEAIGDLEKFLGFKHNLQSLVVAMSLEKSHGDHAMDLTNYTLYGLQAHSGAVYGKRMGATREMLGYYDRFRNEGCKTADGKWAWSLESMLVAEADEIAQRHHDVEDALLGGLITPEEVVKLINKHFGVYDPFRKLSADEKAIVDHPADHDMTEFVALISRVIVNMLVTRLTETAAYQINKISRKAVVLNGQKQNLDNRTFGAYRQLHEPDDDEIKQIFSYVSYEDEQKPLSDRGEGVSERIEAFQGDVTTRVLSSYDIQKADAKGKYIIEQLFKAYYFTPQQLPDHCACELLMEYNRMARDEQLRRNNPKWFRDKFCEIPQDELPAGQDITFGEYLRNKGKFEGIGSVRKMFMEMFEEREKTTVLEKLLLMRVICNHIACMTDTYAQRAYNELYG